MKHLLLTAAFALGATAAAAEFSLDARYTDADGDMVADIPTDPAELVDPAHLIFAYRGQNKSCSKSYAKLERSGNA